MPIDHPAVTAAVLATLRSVIEAPPLSKSVGDHDGTGLTTPYCVLYAVPGGEVDGAPFGDPHEYASIGYRVISVGDRRDQCEEMAQVVREVLLARTPNGYVRAITPAGGAKVQGRWLANQGAPRQEGTLFNMVDDYMLAVWP